MKVLEVVEACNAGVGQHVRGLCEGLYSEGHEVTVAFAPSRMDPAFREFVVRKQNEIRFICLKVRREVSPISDLRAISQLLRLIRSEGPFDIIHGHSSKGGGIARIAGRSAGVPTVYTPNGLIIASPDISRLKAALYASIERILGYGATSKLIAVSEEEREVIRRRKLAPRDRVVVVNNGIGDEYFGPKCRSLADKDPRQNPLVFGSIMRFVAQKAPTHLVEAFARLSSMAPYIPMRLLIAGDGELYGRIEEQVRASGLGEKVTLLGWRSDVREVLCKFDVFVLPSLYEGFSYAVLEAMAARLPIVSTVVSGVRDTVGRVPGNQIVPAGKPDALASGMKQMITLARPGSLRQALREIGQANHSYARTHFNQSQTTHGTLRLYQALQQDQTVPTSSMDR